jgi:two-component system, OmpR family, sensor kinase
MSLRRRLLLTLAPLFIVGLIAVDVATYLSLRSYLVSKVESQLIALHPSVEMYLTSGAFGDGGRGGPQPSTLSIPTGTFGEIVSASGATVAGPHSFGPGGVELASRPTLPATLKASNEQSPVFSTVDGTGGVEHYLVYVDNAQQDVGLLVTAIPLDDVNATLAQLLLLEGLTTAGITIIVLVASWLIVRRGLRPLERMGTMARSAAGDLSRRVEPADDVTEVGQLGIAINTMLSQLETAFAERAASEQRLRHFVSDASHELRTPLTSMRGYAELLRRNPEMTEADVMLATRRIEDEAARMGVLVDDLLLLARLDQGRPLERVPVDLGALVTDACADARATDPTRSITSRIDTPVQVIGDDMRLRQVLGNVVRNALVHTPPATPV